MERQVVTLLLDWGGGPICGEDADERGHLISGIALIDNDPEVQRLCDEIWGIYEKLYLNVPESEENPVGLEFDFSGFGEIAPKLLSLTKELIARLDEINDGSYVVRDRITGELEETIRNKGS